MTPDLPFIVAFLCVVLGPLVVGLLVEATTRKSRGKYLTVNFIHNCKTPNLYKGAGKHHDSGTKWQCGECGRIWEIEPATSIFPGYSLRSWAPLEKVEDK